LLKVLFYNYHVHMNFTRMFMHLNCNIYQFINLKDIDTYRVFQEKINILESDDIGCFKQKCLYKYYSIQKISGILQIWYIILLVMLVRHRLFIFSPLIIKYLLLY
jgi:hypothetical protein